MTFFDKILANDKKNSHNQNSITTILLLNISRVWISEQIICKIFAVKQFQIVNTFACANKPYRNV